MNERISFASQERSRAFWTRQRQETMEFRERMFLGAQANVVEVMKLAGMSARRSSHPRFFLGRAKHPETEALITEGVFRIGLFKEKDRDRVLPVVEYLDLDCRPSVPHRIVMTPQLTKRTSVDGLELGKFRAISDLGAELSQISEEVYLGTCVSYAPPKAPDFPPEE